MSRIWRKADLTFIYSVMKSGKSLDLLKNAHIHRERQQKVLLLTSEKDGKNGLISTRVGLSEKAYVVEKVNLYHLAKTEAPDIIFIDEAQFLHEIQVLMLARIVDRLHIPVVAYGLKTDFQGKLFPGSEAFLRYADIIKELEVPCLFCSNKAVLNMRVNKYNNPVWDGEQIEIGDNYQPVCRKCYFDHQRNENF
jgi:thymidine kinase